jgi:sugar transferase EpsL
MTSEVYAGNFSSNSNNQLAGVWTTETWKAVEKAYLGRQKGMRGQLICKRCLDVAIASLALLILWPLLLIIAFAIRLSSPGPILFRQERLGKLGKPFIIYKFRTMVDGAVHIGTGLGTYKGDPRVTKIGKFLREYHLDELPQLFNVLLGDMSLVGPRPLLVSSLKIYDDTQKRRLLLPPGITAWEAVNGGLENSFEERLQLDVWYVDHWNFWLDLVILLRTIPVVLRKEGVYAK